MKINYDKIADALYIYLRKSHVAKTVKLRDRLIVDLDKSGNLIGMEILDASAQISARRPSKLTINIPAMV